MVFWCYRYQQSLLLRRKHSNGETLSRVPWKTTNYSGKLWFMLKTHNDQQRWWRGDRKSHMGKSHWVTSIWLNFDLEMAECACAHMCVHVCVRACEYHHLIIQKMFIKAKVAINCSAFLPKHQTKQKKHHYKNKNIQKKASLTDKGRGVCVCVCGGGGGGR